MPKTHIQEEGLVGVFVVPDEEGKFPGILLLPGSDGGVPDGFASRISLKGFAVLALGYFGLAGLPPRLENIPLEYFEKALYWLKNHKNVKNISVIGYSRGGELALILGCYFPQLITAIVAYTPNAFVCGAFPYINRPAWTFKGQAINPFLHAVMSAEDDFTEKDDLKEACEKGVIALHAGTDKDPYDVVDLFEKRHTEGCQIPVEKIVCPLLIFSGTEDKIWPAFHYGHLIMKRKQEKGNLAYCQHMYYENVGHGIITSYDGPIYHPHGHFYCHFGGNAEANRKASEDSFQKMIHFLKDHVLT